MLSGVDFTVTPLALNPFDFIAAVNEALEDENTSQRFAEAHTRLFESIVPLHGVAQQTASLKKQEKFLKRQINSMKDDLRLRKQIDRDGGLVPKSVLDMFTANEQVVSESDSEDADDFDDEEEDVEKQATLAPPDSDGELSDDDGDVPRVELAVLRKELLDSGCPAKLLDLDLGALGPGKVDVHRMMSQLVPMPYRGKPCFFFALKPSVFEDGEVAEVNRRLLLLGELCDGSTPSLSVFAGAADLREHIIVCLTHSGGSSLKRIVRAASDGDLRLSAIVQIALAKDLALAVRRLHSAGIVHGSIAPEMAMVTLHQPCSGLLLFTGTASELRKEADIHDLGLLFASLCLGRLVTTETLPSASDIRATGNAASTEDPSISPFLELVVEMTHTSDASLRPSADDVCSRLEGIVNDQGVDESSSRVIESTCLGSVPAIYELQRPLSPLGRF